MLQKPLFQWKLSRNLRKIFRLHFTTFGSCSNIPLPFCHCTASRNSKAAPSEIVTRNSTTGLVGGELDYRRSQILFALVRFQWEMRNKRGARITESLLYAFVEKGSEIKEFIHLVNLKFWKVKPSWKMNSELYMEPCMLRRCMWCCLGLINLIIKGFPRIYIVSCLTHAVSLL